jgi:hypothetical protein
MSKPRDQPTERGHAKGQHSGREVLAAVARANVARLDEQHRQSGRGESVRRSAQDLPEVERLRLVATEILILARELQDCVTDDANYIEPRLGVEIRDSVLMFRLARWAAWDAEIAAWHGVESNRDAANRIRIEQEAGRDVPAHLKRVLDTRPASPRDGADGSERPELLMRDMPALPSERLFVCWEDWLGRFLVARRRRLLTERAQTEITT